MKKKKIAKNIKSKKITKKTKSRFVVEFFFVWLLEFLCEQNMKNTFPFPFQSTPSLSFHFLFNHQERPLDLHPSVSEVSHTII